MSNVSHVPAVFFKFLGTFIAVVYLGIISLHCVEKLVFDFLGLGKSRVWGALYVCVVDSLKLNARFCPLGFLS
jgi:hypothetical protein